MYLARSSGDAHNKDHFLFQLPIIVVFWTHFPVEVKKLFQRLVFGREYILNDGHQELGLWEQVNKVRWL